MDLQQLCAVLQACLSPDQAQRSTAEAVLKQHEHVKGQAVNLLRVAAEESVDTAVRQVAAITFKNLVKRSWQLPDEAPKQPDAFQLSDEDKQIVRDNLLDSLIRAPHTVQLQLEDVFKTVAYTDYPAHWPGLLHTLTQNLVSPDHSQVHGGLLALRILSRKYEFRDEDDRAPLAEIVNTTFPLLLHILQQLLAAPVLTPELCVFIKLVCKVFWSCTYMGVPDLLVQPEHFQAWMGALLKALQQTYPEAQQPVSHEDRPAHPWWKSRKWLHHILYRMVSRYSTARHCKEGNDTTFAHMFAAQSGPFLEGMLAQVHMIASGAYVSPRVVNLVFQYLAVCLKQKDAYTKVGPMWDDILANVAFPLMCFSDQDAQLWAEDPAEYVRKGYDILEDMYSPKTAVANFAHDLCQHKRTHLDKFMALMVTILQQFTQAAAASGGHVDLALARRADGALLAVGVMRDLMESKKPYKQQLGGMLVNLVVPVMSSPHGHLRSKAVWVAGVYSEAQFPEGVGAGASFNAIFAKVVSMLGDPELPVRVDTVVALRQFIDTCKDSDSLKPILPNLLNSIFQLMGEIDAEDLVFSLEALVQKFGSDIAPYAAQMVAQLASAFERYTNTAEEEDDDDDMAGLAAYGCLRAINTLLESVSSLTDLFPALEQALHPLLVKLLTTEGQDMLEEVLEMLAYLTYFGPGISPRIWSLWPQLHTMLLEWGIDYWENLLTPLDNMISRDTATFLGSKEPDYQASVFQMVQHSLTGEYEDTQVVPAARLLHVVLQACRGHVDQWVGPYVMLALQRLARAEKPLLKDALVEVVANALYYNPTLTLQALAGAGAVQTFFSGWFGMLMASKKSGKMKHFGRMHDKKVCALGLLVLLAQPEGALPVEVAASRHLLLMGVVRLLTALKVQEQEKAEEDAEEEETDEDEEEEQQEEADDDDADSMKSEEKNEYMKRLAKKARDLLGGGADSDDDDDWTEDDDVSTPIDPVDPYILLSDALSAMAATAPALHQALLATVGADESARNGLQELLQHADKQRQEQAAAAAAAVKVI